jgi:hypothetical protein
MSRLLAMRRGDVDMLFRPRPRKNSSVGVWVVPSKGNFDPAEAD